MRRGTPEMKKEDLTRRTRLFALGIIRLVESLPKGRIADVLARQLLRSGTSVGTNYRAACRARSTADFIAKMGLVEEELDESAYWMELIVEGRVAHIDTVEPLMKEADELLAIVVLSIKTARARKECGDANASNWPAIRG
jgi:four helix bundle protein